MRLVDDDDRVAIEERVCEELTQQSAIRHELDARVAARAVVEAHRVTHDTTQGYFHLLSHSRRQRRGGDAPWLCHGDRPPARRPTRLVQELRQLRRLAAARLCDEDEDAAALERKKNRVAVRVNRECGARAGYAGSNGHTRRRDRRDTITMILARRPHESHRVCARRTRVP